ncbi:MAG: T9SS type A sorting domain-containing protein [Bacteroidales bacterium]|nr:T9SS type A sorting domain-containing protein [Bacteroidales bacterium]
MRYLIICLLIVLSIKVGAQTTNELEIQLKERGEVYISILEQEVKANYKLLNNFSFDKNENGRVYYYGNKRAISSIKDKSINIQLEPIPSLLYNIKMLENTAKFSTTWDAYPTYNQYDSLMHKFATDYPNLCKFHTLGSLNSGREILALQLGDSVNIDQNEPQFLYTSTMHGDETVGYIITLRLIEYLLQNYNTNTQVKYIMDNVDIWINPLANPDGTYHTGNSTVNGAIRYNANNIDLNRNYPDPEDGMHPDGNIYQEETEIFMDFADSMHFVMSANLHSGAEVINYPWDTWSQLPADNDWWIYVSKMFADTAQYYSPSGYMTKFGSGYTNGYQWYSVYGGRQDYMNYFHHCREFTVELSNTKLLPESQLLNHWNYIYPSMLNYLEEATYGIKGRVTDSITGYAVKAKVEILNHDIDSSLVYSNDSGYYHRPIYTGTYNVKYSANGYNSKTVNNIVCNIASVKIENVQLLPIIEAINIINDNSIIHIYPNPVFDKVKISSPVSISNIIMYDAVGRLVYEKKNINMNSIFIETSTYKSGIYFIRIAFKSQLVYRKIIIK